MWMRRECTLVTTHPSTNPQQKKKHKQRDCSRSARNSTLRTSFVTGVKSVSIAAVSRKPKWAYEQYPHSTHKNASKDS